MTTEQKKWSGTWPARCDYCHSPLENFHTFVDGRTKSGFWALMCPWCHTDNGIGIGLGKGQQYDSKTLVKIAG